MNKIGAIDLILDIATEAMNQEQKKRLQEEKLRTLFQRVYEKSEFYREKMDKLKIDAEAKDVFGSLEKMPFTTDEDIKRCYPFGLLTMPVSGVAFFDYSLEEKIAAGFTLNDRMRRIETICRSLVACDITMCSTLLIDSHGIGLDELNLMQQAAERIGITVLINHDRDLVNMMAVLRDFGVTTLYTSTERSKNFGAYLNENRQKCFLQSILCNASHCNDQEKSDLETQFNIPIYRLYNVAEKLGLFIGSECVHQEGIHIHDDYFYVEVINQDGMALPYGESGELVVTTLSHEAMPILRYRTGKKAVMENSVCKCGRTSLKVQFFS